MKITVRPQRGMYLLHWDFYPVCPGASEYVLGSPLFNKATLSLPGGKQFVIHAENASEDNCYIRSATLNGKNFSHNFLKHEELMQGGELKLIMDCVPDKERGVKPEDAPYSYNKINLLVELISLFGHEQRNDSFTMLKPRVLPIRTEGISHYD